MEETKQNLKMLILALISTIVTLCATVFLTYEIVVHILAEHYIVLLSIPFVLGFMLAFAFAVSMFAYFLYEYEESKNK